VDAAEIEVFLALAEELHFSRTAERPRLPQSRVSRLVASLERRIGGVLFERTSRRADSTAHCGSAVRPPSSSARG
jgi:DNA-binding transcriptional LysR family regulator